ncbi:IclR family transcriptional regulator [Actinobacteria bacterium YIM 96077]|uniref:IclR family transcriptional regulator n=1 Tax=Phytoactinopolyspora halophila TaxID=1981511 RepID=A0A329R718_9ACTN|nr:IclR family transcriptional regulator [Phytoactinopolyspora halophila]AYY11898.1 IclR family transcriptional regulator [Actinobacteria bacterium YIM 96077]RAW18868.1 IclR family transcriptional regulator [Phytoactinopolyspora halophila]
MGESSRVPALRNGVRILRQLARHGGPMPAAALAAELDLPRSSVYHLLAELERDGLVMHLPEERRYGLGIGVFELGTAYSRQEPLARLARPVLARLVDDVGHGGHLAVLHGREVLYLLEERAPGSPPLVTEVGVRLPAHLTASGRAILADLASAQVRALFPDPSAFADRHGVGPRSLSALRSVLADARSRGYATEQGEVTPGLASIGVSAHDHTGYPVAAVAVTFRQEAVGQARWPRLAARITRASEELTRRVGGVPAS